MLKELDDLRTQLRTRIKDDKVILAQQREQKAKHKADLKGKLDIS